MDADLSERDARLVKGWLYRILFLGVLLGACLMLFIAILLNLDFT